MGNLSKQLFLCLLFILYNQTLVKAGDIERLQKMLDTQKRSNPLDLPNHDFRAQSFDAQETLSFVNSNFQNGNFSGTVDNPKRINNIDFSECNLGNANFSYCIITHCKFNDAQLKGVKFEGSTIKFTSFRRAVMPEANLNLTQQESVGYDEANITCSTWVGADLFRVSFTRTDERGMDKTDLKERDCSHEYAVTTGLFDSFSCKKK